MGVIIKRINFRRINLIALIIFVFACNVSFAIEAQKSFSQLTARERYFKIESIFRLSRLDKYNEIRELLDYIGPKGQLVYSEKNQIFEHILFLGQYDTPETISILLNYIGPKSELTQSQIEELTETMDKGGENGHARVVMEFLNYGLVPRNLMDYKIRAEYVSRVDRLLPIHQQGTLGLWHWIKQELSKKVVSRWHFPFALSASNDILEAYFTDVLLLPFQAAIGVPMGLVKEKKFTKMLSHVNLISYVLIQNGLLKNQFNLPSSRKEKVFSDDKFKSYNSKVIFENFQKFLSKMKNKTHSYSLNEEILKQGIFQTALEMKMNGRFYEHEEFKKAVIRNCGY